MTLLDAPAGNASFRSDVSGHCMGTGVQVAIIDLQDGTDFWNHFSGTLAQTFGSQ
jgi:hypothetical protein